MTDTIQFTCEMCGAKFDPHGDSLQIMEFDFGELGKREVIAMICDKCQGRDEPEKTELPWRS